VLRRMRRSYRAERYLGIIDRVRAAIPHAAITTDIIVGFPGETEADFQATLDVVGQARFAGAFTFQYSKRPGTPAAELPDQIGAETVRDRYGRLVELQDQLAWDANRELMGQQVEVLVAEGEGRKDTGTGRLSGRARDGRLVHVRTPTEGALPRPGDLVQSVVTRGAPHYLVADGEPLSIRRTLAGDAAAAGQRPVTPRTSTPGAEAVSLGLPRIGAPA
jgi:tRNA-2-methylthio-N6-dimethylallyladenosine synthase